MEAALFQQVFNALNDHERKLNLPLENACPLTKVVWSSFDYTAGPELKFNTIDETSSTAHYEDIDDVFATGLLNAELAEDDLLMRELDLRWDASIMEESAYSSDVATDSTLTESTTHQSARYCKISGQCHLSLNEPGPSQEATDLDGPPYASNTADSGLTSPVHGNAHRNDSSMSAQHSSADEACGAADTTMKTSCVDSGIAGTVSTHSDLSALCRNCEGSAQNEHPREGTSVSGQASPAKERASGFDVDKEAEVFAAMSATASAQPVTDEEFVAKFALAEQICSTQLSSNPVIHKFTVVPTRKIACGSYLFMTKSDRVNTTMTAFSVVMPHDKYEWYIERQSIVERIFTDIIARFKAAYLVETMEDLICRLSREFASLFQLFGALEKWPVRAGPLKPTYLWDQKWNDADLQFVSKAVTGCLMSQGHCTIVGNNVPAVEKMFLTLTHFLDVKQRMFSLRPYRHQFSPYFTLQAIRRAELDDVLTSAANCFWPMTLVDVDRRLVSYCGPYSRQRSVKSAAQYYQVAQILREAGVRLPPAEDRQTSREPQIELQTFRACSRVLEFLSHLYIVPQSRTARSELIDHFHLRLHNHAVALIELVREMSEPSHSDKTAALSGKWSLASARKALGLTSDATFGVVLAKADSVKPEFAEFVCQTKSIR